METEKQLGATRDGFLLMRSSYDSLLKIMRKEVYAPKWFLDICDESKNMTQGLLYLILEMEKKKKKPFVQFPSMPTAFCSLQLLECWPRNPESTFFGT